MDICVQRKKRAIRKPRVFKKIKYRKMSCDILVRKFLTERQLGKCAGLMIFGNHYPCKEIPTDCDHIIELQYGGQDILHNLQMLCHECHSLKTIHNRKTRWETKKYLSMHQWVQ
jgi:5-methylcytosine-specific restriction endonuclease McrA